MKNQNQMPGYWMDEQSGVLAPVVKAFLEGKALTLEQIAIMRAYLRQWMAGPWEGEGVTRLRDELDQITDSAALHRWFQAALDAGIDPL